MTAYLARVDTACIILNNRMNKRILIITRNFPPLVGGMERLIWNVFKQLNSDYICDIVGPRGCKRYVFKKNNCAESCVTPFSLFLGLSLIKSLWSAWKNKYDLCVAGSGVTAPVAIIIGKLFKIPTITFLHGLDIVVENRFYEWIFLPVIRRSDKIIVNSFNTAKLAELRGIAFEKIEVLFPGVEIPQIISKNSEFQNQYNLKNKKVLLSVGRLIPRKGLIEFLYFSFPQIIKKNPNIVFLIIGSEAINALKKSDQLLGDIKEVIKKHKLVDHVFLLGRVNDETLESAYQEADLFVFPLQEVVGDVEGFGMVAVEAAAYGLPTIAFAVGGVKDAIKNEISGFLIPPGEYSQFTEKIINYLKADNTVVTSETCRNYAKNFSWEKFGKRLRAICEQVVK